MQSFEALSAAFKEKFEVSHFPAAPARLLRLCGRSTVRDDITAYDKVDRHALESSGQLVSYVGVLDINAKRPLLDAESLNARSRSKLSLRGRFNGSHIGM